MRAMNAKDDSSDLQPKKGNVDAQDENGRDSMVWNNEWDDNDSTLGDRELESQRILGYPNGSGGVIDEDEEAIEDEIRANLSSKVSSSLHAYKIAGVALIITLISFTINTVLSRGHCRLLIMLGICTIRTETTIMGEAILHALPTPLIVVLDGTTAVPLPPNDLTVKPLNWASPPLTHPLPPDNRSSHPLRISVRNATEPHSAEIHALCHRYPHHHSHHGSQYLVSLCVSHLHLRRHGNVQLQCILCLRLLYSSPWRAIPERQGVRRRTCHLWSFLDGMGHQR